jgi:hypothetical protein
MSAFCRCCPSRPLVICAFDERSTKHHHGLSSSRSRLSGVGLFRSSRSGSFLAAPGHSPDPGISLVCVVLVSSQMRHQRPLKWPTTCTYITHEMDSRGSDRPLCSDTNSASLHQPVRYCSADWTRVAVPTGRWWDCMDPAQAPAKGYGAHPAGRGWPDSAVRGAVRSIG